MKTVNELRANDGRVLPNLADLADWRMWAAVAGILAVGAGIVFVLGVIAGLMGVM